MTRVAEWDDFIARWPARFKQGEHVTVIGPTGCGKTVLSRELVEARRFVVATGIKYKDSSLSDLIKGRRNSSGPSNLDAKWTRVEKWKDRPKNAERVILWPNVGDLSKVRDVHRKVFTDMFHDVFKTGSWCIRSDELRYLTDLIRLKDPIVQLYITGRSNNISLVSSAQRPSHVPLEAYSQAQHLFLFRTGDERDLTRMGGLNGNSAKQVAATVADLPHHHFLYVNLNNGEQIISTVKKG